MVLICTTNPFLKTCGSFRGVQLNTPHGSLIGLGHTVSGWALSILEDVFCLNLRLRDCKIVFGFAMLRLHSHKDNMVLQ